MFVAEAAKWAAKQGYQDRGGLIDVFQINALPELIYLSQSYQIL
jgi:hypothetical protein